MLLDFLKSYKEELLNEKTTVEEALDALRTRLLESQRFLSVIKEETEEVFTDFTPRNINSKNKERIDETEAEIADYEKQISAMELRLSNIEKKLASAHDAIAEASGYLSRSNKDITISKDELIMILSYILADPMRAKIELEQLL